MLFVEHPKCSTCKKAKKWLDDHGLQYEDRHIVENNPSANEIRAWQLQSGLSIGRFFNTSGKLYREMGLKNKIKVMSNLEMLALLGTDGMLVKRPILVTDDAVLVGFKEEQWAQTLL